ncbi:MAG: geranylgeranyl reductase family protein [Candidatus Hodarchaeales archaeon]|jgi:geranylgeranyl reductase family protein
MIKETDILVIGGGPAGSCAATAAASEGKVRVVLIEEHRHVGWPNHCSGLISSSGLHLVVKNVPRSCIENTVSKANFYSPSGYHFQVSREKKNEMLVLKRPVLDRYLLEQAIKCGVEVLYSTKVNSIHQGKEKSFHQISAVETSSRGSRNKRKNVLWKSKVFINAEGYKEQLATLQGFNKLDPRWRLPALQYELENTPDLDQDAVDLYHGSFAPGFFAWIIPTESDCSRVGLAVSRQLLSNVNCKKLLDHFIKKHPIASRKLKGYKIIKKRGGQVQAAGPRKKAVLGNMLLVGDVAGQVKATTGGGVNIGSYCGFLAGIRAAEHAKLEKKDKETLLKYDNDWKKLFYTELYLMMLYRKIVGSLPDIQIDRLFKATMQSSFSSNLEKGGNVDLHSKMLLKAAINPQIIKEGLRQVPGLFLLFLSTLMK